MNLHIVAVEPIVDVRMWVRRSKLMQTPLIKDVILKLIRLTIYDHLCTDEEAVVLISSPIWVSLDAILVLTAS
ncbi:hypothetical protein ACFX13_000890 [Malus domestica]